MPAGRIGRRVHKNWPRLLPMLAKSMQKASLDLRHESYIIVVLALIGLGGGRGAENKE